MPKKIIIVRHGETDYNAKKIIQGHLDVPLNKKGMEQADKAAHALKNEIIDVFYSSDLQRALVTAKKSALHHKKEVVVTPSLRERCFGKLEGISVEEIVRMIPSFTLEQNFSIPDNLEKEHHIETDSALKKRASTFVKEMQKHKNKTVALFSHGRMIRNLLAEFGIPSEFIRTMHIENASPIILEKKGSNYTLISF